MRERLDSNGKGNAKAEITHKSQNKQEDHKFSMIIKVEKMAAAGVMILFHIILDMDVQTQIGTLAPSILLSGESAVALRKENGPVVLHGGKQNGESSFRPKGKGNNLRIRQQSKSIKIHESSETNGIHAEHMALLDAGIVGTESCCQFCPTMMEALREQQQRKQRKLPVLMNVTYECQNNPQDDDELGNWIMSVYAMRQQAAEHGSHFMFSCTDGDGEIVDESASSTEDQGGGLLHWFHGDWPFDETNKTVIADGDKNDSCKSFTETSPLVANWMQADFRRMAISTLFGDSITLDNQQEQSNNPATNQSIQQTNASRQTQNNVPHKNGTASPNGHDNNFEIIGDIAIHFHCDDFASFSSSPHRYDHDYDEEDIETSNMERRKRTQFSTLTNPIHHHLNLEESETTSTISTETETEKTLSIGVVVTAPYQPPFPTANGITDEQKPDACHDLGLEFEEFVAEEFPTAHVSFYQNGWSSHNQDDVETLEMSLSRLIMARHVAIVSTSSVWAHFAAAASFGMAYIVPTSTTSSSSSFLTDVGFTSLFRGQ